MNICTQTDPDEVQLENGHKVMLAYESTGRKA